MQEFIERIACKLLVVGLFILIVVAVLGTAGCGMVSGLCQDVSSASNAIAASATRNKENQDAAKE